jgi:hypothetical protein
MSDRPKTSRPAPRPSVMPAPAAPPPVLRPPGGGAGKTPLRPPGTVDTPKPRPWDGAVDPDPLFTREEVDLMVPRREFEAVYAYYARYAEGLAAEVEHRFWGFAHVELRENQDNYGLYLLRQDFPVPFLWFGLGWGSDDAPGTLPSWGASLEVNGAHVASFRRDEGGLRPACEAAAKASEERLGLYVFDEHVELAEWRTFDWLLGQPNQQKALTKFWAGYLDLLSAHGVGEAMDEFVRVNE